MNKVLIILFSAYYMLASVGVAINVHYCAGEVSSIDVLSKKSLCCCESDGQRSSCCDDETLFFQMDDEQQFFQSSKMNFEQSFKMIALSNLVTADILNSDDEDNFRFEDIIFSPPLKEPLWLNHCSLVYYG